MIIVNTQKLIVAESDASSRREDCEPNQRNNRVPSNENRLSPPTHACEGGNSGEDETITNAYQGEEEEKIEK